MTWERYRDDYGPRVALSFPYDEKAKNALKSGLGFPGVKWDGERKKWSVRDNPSDLTNALDILLSFGYDFPGLDAEDAPVEKEGSVEYRPPDKLRMRWPYKPNYADINTAVKSCGQAKFDKKSKEGVIPLIAGVDVAAAVKPHYKQLHDAILEIPEVKEAHGHMAERVLLSSAVEAEPMWLPNIKNAEEVRPYQWAAPQMFATGGQNRLLLGDEMGLGKSLQALLCVLAGQYQRILIVCPAVVKVNWANEVEKWTELTPSVVYGRSGDYETGDVTIVNYDLLQHRLDALCEDDYDCVVFRRVSQFEEPEGREDQGSQAPSQVAYCAGHHSHVGYSNPEQARGDIHDTEYAQAKHVPRLLPVR